MDITTITILRLLHICAAVFWAGASIYLAAFVFPAVSALGPQGKVFTQQLMKTNNLPMWMNITGIVTIVAGGILYWEVSLHLNVNWISSTHGIILTAGVITSTVAFILGLTINKPTAARMAAIGMAIAQAGGPPAAHQIRELEMLTARIKKSTNAIAWLVGLGIVSMAIFRYIY